ncbi:MAG: helix-turn-helix transcriptional regulator [Acidobacteria bacterium]|nr:helix-turn-helix transcriptional regulator [Acidobacteriota bacterium]
MAKPAKIRQVQLVGKKIRELRKQRSLTQTELAGRIGIQQSDLSRMEKGEYRVSLDTLFRILGEFGMGVGEFFDGMAEETFTQRDISLVREFNSLPSDAQREVQEFIAFKREQSPAPLVEADTRQRSV